jgi:hypothetical protein
MIATPAAHRPADTLAGTAAQPWCALGTARGTDRSSSGVVDAGMSPVIAPHTDDWTPMASRPARLPTVFTDSHAIQYT